MVCNEYLLVWNLIYIRYLLLEDICSCSIYFIYFLVLAGLLHYYHTRIWTSSFQDAVTAVLCPVWSDMINHGCFGTSWLTSHWALSVREDGISAVSPQFRQCYASFKTFSCCMKTKRILFGQIKICKWRSDWTVMLWLSRVSDNSSRYWSSIPGFWKNRWSHQTHSCDNCL